ncbi:alpha/beta hydrolase-fold protein [Mariniflexile soesokkakense]|uniref:Alpha/beta hydrolase-fold protein n=1 Tax=Mariniflexile soesokkakense TaxID=1343160 RepID=A0ABV0ADE5_9FLAO
MKTFLFIIGISCCQMSFCQVTCIIDTLPKNHDFKKDVYISGDFEGWSGGKEDYKLTKSNNYYHITISKLRETINFKFTLGSWDFSECDLNSNPIENRVHTFSNSLDTIHLKIANWTNGTSKINRSTASKNVHVLAEHFKIPQLNRKRKISVYLPPNYETSNKKYPVLYMHDGQNVFDLATSYAGEWEVDETLNKLSEEKGLNLIVVATNHGNEKRISEYSPWHNPKYGEAEGDAYLEFIVNTLKPKIDKIFRTKKSVKNTAIMGSSMGGLISHYAGLKYPKVFSKVGVFSPSFWYSDESFLYTEKHANLKHVKMYYLVGGKEGEEMVENVEKMGNIMKMNKFPKNNICTKIVPNGTHSESFWKSEFENAILWLFN